MRFRSPRRCDPRSGTSRISAVNVSVIYYAAFSYLKRRLGAGRSSLVRNWKRRSDTPTRYKLRSLSVGRTSSRARNDDGVDSKHGPALVTGTFDSFASDRCRIFNTPSTDKLCHVRECTPPSAPVGAHICIL